MCGRRYRWLVPVFLVWMSASAYASYTVVMVSGQNYQCVEKYQPGLDGLILLRLLDGGEVQVVSGQIDYFETAFRNGETPTNDMEPFWHRPLFNRVNLDTLIKIMARQGWIVAVIGCLIFLIARLWYVVVAFRVNAWWGLARLFLPVAPTVFPFLYWEEARRPLFCSWFGLFLVGVSLYIWGDLFVRVFIGQPGWGSKLIFLFYAI